MFPVGDENESQNGVAILTIALIALNVLAFLVEINQPSEAALQSFIEAWGVVPRDTPRVRICRLASRTRSGRRC